MVVTLFLDMEALAAPPSLTGERGHPRNFDEPVLRTVLILRALMAWPLRVAEGYAKALFGRAGLAEAVPSYPTLCRRLPELDIQLPKLRRGEAHYVLVDSTGAKVFGENEWKVRMHGYSYRRTWRKVHFSYDPETRQILEVVDTAATVHDVEVLPALVRRHDLTGATVIGDGAYDSRRAYAGIAAKGGRLLVPPVPGPGAMNALTTRETVRCAASTLSAAKPGNAAKATTAVRRWNPSCIDSNG